MRAKFMDALYHTLCSQLPSHKQIVTLLEAEGEEVKELFDAADRVRASGVGNEVHLRGIIEFSNYCIKNCCYCGLRKSNKQLTRYRLTKHEILETAEKASSMGLKTIVLQSGEDPYYTGEVLAEMVIKLKSRLDIAITLSVGDRTRGEYQLFREAGTDRYLIKHETSNPSLFSRLRPGTNLQDRVERLTWLNELGYQVGSGCMVGLPGQGPDTLAGDILLMHRLGVEMAGIGPFIPHPHTPLSSYPGGGLEETMKVLAVTRLVLPQAHLPATTAVGSIHSDGRKLALCCGANVIMPNVTPMKYRPHYQIYPNKACLTDDTGDILDHLSLLITSLGRKVATDHGHSPNYKSLN